MLGSPCRGNREDSCRKFVLQRRVQGLNSPALLVEEGLLRKGENRRGCPKHHPMRPHMKTTRTALCFAMVFCLIMPVTFSFAEEEGVDFTLGARIGTTGGTDEQDFVQYELVGTFEFPWTREEDSSPWDFSTWVELAAGLLDGEQEEEDSAVGSLTVGITAFAPDEVFAYSVGLGAGVLEEEQVGPTNFGGPVFFIFRAGIDLYLTKSLSIGYNFLHQSNGSIYDENPSLNLHSFEIEYHF